MKPSPAVAFALSMVVAAAGCRRTVPGTRPLPTMVLGDATRGREVVIQFECTRCHTVEGAPEPPKDKQCTGCHRDIGLGNVRATPQQLTRWQPKVEALGDVPTLMAVGARFEREWIKGFLMKPHDLRPALAPTMPRLPLTEQQAADVATFLSPRDAAPTSDAEKALAGADAARGGELMDVKGCGVCHRMAGARPLRGGMLPAGVAVKMLPAVRLAPDLRYTRDRWRASSLVAWLMDPPSIKSDTLMPKMGLSLDEAKSVAKYILSVPLGLPDEAPVPARLAILDRKVTYDEVAARVFRKTCWHCHGEPDFERGDGGPGNSGGFGFHGRGLNLSDYGSTFAGYLDDRGRRTSIFATGPDGAPYLVSALLARQGEERGQEGPVRGMPLGLPAASPEDIQLVETWIAQGRAR